jgi:hypothetical protein
LAEVCGFEGIERYSDPKDWFTDALWAVR